MLFPGHLVLMRSLAIPSVQTMFMLKSWNRRIFATAWWVWHFFVSPLYTPTLSFASPDFLWQVSRGQVVRGSVAAMAMAMAPSANVPCRSLQVVVRISTDDWEGNSSIQLVAIEMIGQSVYVCLLVSIVGVLLEVMYSVYVYYHDF